MKLLASLLLAVSIFGSPKPVSINLNPHVGFAPLEVKGYATIEPNEKNRSACLVFNSDNYLAQSCKDLEGKDAVKSNPIHKILPTSGKYDISVVVYQNDGKMIQSNIERIEVLGVGGEHESAPTRPDGTFHAKYRIR